MVFTFPYTIHKFQKGKLQKKQFIQAIQKIISPKKLSPDILHNCIFSVIISCYFYFEYLWDKHFPFKDDFHYFFSNNYEEFKQESFIQVMHACIYSNTLEFPGKLSPYTHTQIYRHPEINHFHPAKFLSVLFCPC